MIDTIGIFCLLIENFANNFFCNSLKLKHFMAFIFSGTPFALAYL